MRALRHTLLILFIAGAAVAGPARRPAPVPRPEPVKVEVSASRDRNRFGIVIGGLEPLGSIVGVNLAYNVTSFTRLTLGFGWFPLSVQDSSGATVDGSVTSLAGSLKLFVPGWSFSPFIGGGITNVEAKGVGTANTISQAFGVSATKAFFTFGFDWQLGAGLQLALGGHLFQGYKVRQTGPTSGTVTEEGTLVLPHVSVGWFFDWLNY